MSVDLGIDEILMLFIAGRCKEIFGLGIGTSTTIADVHNVKDVKKSVGIQPNTSIFICPNVVSAP